MPCNLGVLGLVLIAGCVSIVNGRRKTYIKFLRVVPFDTWIVSYSFVGPVGLGATEKKGLYGKSEVGFRAVGFKP